MVELKQVDVNKPYVFVSYANADDIQVHADLVRLQSAGVNLWVDTNLARYTGKSWKKVVQHTMKNINCKAVLVFVSKFSLISSAVKCELDIANSIEVKGTHFGKALPILPIEVTPFDSITQFCYQIAAECTETKGEKELPDEDELLPSDNVIYMQNKYFNNDDIMHYCIFKQQNLEPFIENLKTIKVVVESQTTEYKLQTRDGHNYIKKGKEYKSKGRLDEAINCFKEAANYGLADAYAEIGRLYGSKTEPKILEYRRAESCLQRAVDLNKMSARLDLATLYYKGGEYKLAEKVVKEIKKADEYKSNIEVREKCEQILRKLKIKF